MEETRGVYYGVFSRVKRKLTGLVDVINCLKEFAREEMYAYFDVSMESV